MEGDKATPNVRINSWGVRVRLKRRPLNPENLHRFVFPAPSGIRRDKGAVQIVQPSPPFAAALHYLPSRPPHTISQRALAFEMGNEKVPDGLPWKLRRDRKSVKKDPNFTYGDFDLPKWGKRDSILSNCGSKSSNKDLKLGNDEVLKLGSESNQDLGKRKREFSIQLTPEEIEEDFLKMAGRKPAPRPNKRSKKLQQQIDVMFPGTGLSSNITPDLYEVDEQF